MDYTFIFFMGLVSFLLFKADGMARIAGLALGFLSICAVAPALPGMLSRGVADAAGIEGLSGAFDVGLTVLIPVLALLYMVGIRPSSPKR